MFQAEKCIKNCGNYGSQQNGGMCNSCYNKFKPNIPFESSKDTILEENWFEHLCGCVESDINTKIKQFKKEKDGRITLINSSNNKEYDCGYYDVMSIGELSQELDWTPIRTVLPIEIITRDDIESIKYVDVGYLQSTNPGAMFQCASNFNGIEAPNDDMHPGMKNFTTIYTHDKTQGPTASISVGPAAISRVYAAYYDENKDCSQWKQTKDKQINFLGDELVSKHFPMNNGYVCLTGNEPTFPKPNTKEWDLLLKASKVGIVSKAQVTFGNRFKNNNGFLVAQNCEKENVKVDQIFCAAVNISQGKSGILNSRQKSINDKANFALQVAYEGAYLSAIRNKNKTLFLTLIGGGVFGNSLDNIYQTIIDTHQKYSSILSASSLECVKVVLFRESDISPSFFELLKVYQIPFNFYKYYRGQKKLVEKFEPEIFEDF